MPSPALIPRSKSFPDITSPQSPSDLQATSKSVRSTRSTGSPITTWPKKIENYIKKGKTKNNPELTEENLEEFNRRNALIEARYNSSSPYYKGLTDFSKVINREKLISCPSPGRESHAASFVSSGSRSSFVFMVSSCFSSRKNEKSSHDTHLTSSLKITKMKTKNQDPESERKRVTFPEAMQSEDNTIFLSTMEKPLRERDCEPPPELLLVPPPTASPPELLPVPPPTASLPELLPVPPPTASPPESLPYPLPQIITPPPPPPVAVQAPLPEIQASGGVIYKKEEIRMTETEKKYVWADKYRPFWLHEFLSNRKTALWIKSIVRSWHDREEECGHFIFEGNPGVGKRTMIWALLREAFGPEKVQAREECKKFYLKGETVSSILVNVLVSPRHVEINLSELKGYEKHVIVELIKEKHEMVMDTSLQCNQQNCKAIILHEAEKLSTDTLLYIKWMLEKFKGCNKVFFCCSDAKKLQAIKPLCTYVQLLEPSIEEILEVLAFIAKQEEIQLPLQLANKIANNSKNNLRQAIRSFEATWHFSASLQEDQDIKTGWEGKIANIAENVLEEQSPKQLYNIRGELQNLIEHNVAPEFIFQTLKEELEKILPEHLQPQFHHLYDEYQKNHANKKYFSLAYQEEELGKRQNDQRLNVQQFMRIEEFIARFMSWYKALAIKNKEVLPDQIQGGDLMVI